jgi:hypothetical protein
VKKLQQQKTQNSISAASITNHYIIDNNKNLAIQINLALPQKKFNELSNSGKLNQLTNQLN